MEHGQVARRRHLERGAERREPRRVRVSADRRRPVEVSIRSLHQPRVGPSAVGADELVNRRRRAAERHLERDADVPRSAEVRRAVQVAVRGLDQRRDRIAARGAAGEQIERRHRAARRDSEDAAVARGDPAGVRGAVEVSVARLDEAGVDIRAFARRRAAQRPHRLEAGPVRRHAVDRAVAHGPTVVGRAVQHPVGALNDRRPRLRPFSRRAEERMQERERAGWRHSVDRALAGGAAAGGRSIQVAVGCLEQRRIRCVAVRRSTGKRMEDREVAGRRHAEHGAQSEGAAPHRRAVEDPVARAHQLRAGRGAVSRGVGKRMQQVEARLCARVARNGQERNRRDARHTETSHTP